MKFDEREIMEGAWHELPPTIEGVVGDKHKKKRVCNECIFTVVVAILCLLSLWYLYNYFYGVRRAMAPSSGIEGYPPILKSGVKYVMSSEHIDEMGRDRIVLCQLQLINPQATLILSWDMEDPTKIVYRNLSNRYIKVEKTFVNRRPRTYYSLTEKGKKEFLEYLSQLEAFLKEISNIKGSQKEE